MAADVSKIDPYVSAWSLDGPLDIRSVPTLFEPRIDLKTDLAPLL